ncbi:MAG: universal stress protein [candidate division NC10 bacterium]
MFKHILVPMDLSGGHQRALRVALALAVAYRARVTLLHSLGRKRRSRVE